MQQYHYLTMDAVKTNGCAYLRIFVKRKSRYQPDCLTGFVLDDTKIKQVESLDYIEDFGDELFKSIKPGGIGKVKFTIRQNGNHHELLFQDKEFFKMFKQTKEQYLKLLSPQSTLF